MKIELHERTLRELDQPWPDHWNDPELLAAMSPMRLHALRNNPLARSDDLSRVVATRDGSVVGRIECFRGEYYSPTGARPFWWASHLDVAREHQRQGVGRALIGRLAAFGMVGGCGLSHDSFLMFRRLGWTLEALPRFVLVRHSAPLIRSLLRNPAMSTWLASVPDLLLRRRENGMFSALRKLSLHYMFVSSRPPTTRLSTLGGCACFTDLPTGIDGLRMNHSRPAPRSAR